MRFYGFLLLALVSTGCAASSTNEEAEASDSALTSEKAYAMVFGYQDALNRPRNSHTFTTFVRVRPETDGTLTILEQQDISWLPRDFTGAVCVLECAAEPGHNYTLNETLGFFANASSSYRMRAAVWGPYEISRDLFDLATNEARWLASGDVAYIAEDGNTSASAFAREPGGAYNCIAASTGFFPTPWNPREPEFRRGPLEWGLRASESAANALSRSSRGVANFDRARAIFAATGVSGHGVEWRTPTR